VVRTGTTKRVSARSKKICVASARIFLPAPERIPARFRFTGLSEFAEPLLALVNELAREAAFPDTEFDRERRQKLEEVKLERTQPGIFGERAIA